MLLIGTTNQLPPLIGYRQQKGTPYFSARQPAKALHPGELYEVFLQSNPKEATIIILPLVMRNQIGNSLTTMATGFQIQCQ